jgi:hypothetical protein
MAVPFLLGRIRFGCFYLHNGINHFRQRQGNKPKYGEAVARRSSEMINFSRNMALLGSALALMGVEEPWPASVCVAQPGALETVRNLTRQAEGGLIARSPIWNFPR